MPHFQRRWKWPKVLIALMVIELAGTVPALALFGIASPNLYRTKLWRIGSDNGFNSSPLQVLYAYANYRPIPKIPFVWSQSYDPPSSQSAQETHINTQTRLTDFNVAVSVLSMFVLLVKAAMFLLHIWYPILSTLTNLPIVVLWAVSVYGQMGPDHSDPKHPSNIAWYLTKSCSYARPSGNYGYCLQAKGAFAVTVVMLYVFFPWPLPKYKSNTPQSNVLIEPPPRNLVSNPHCLPTRSVKSRSRRHANQALPALRQLRP
jgi:hypothetical protein